MKTKEPHPWLIQSPLVSIPAYARSKGIDPRKMRLRLKMVGLRGRVDPKEADARLAAAKSQAKQGDFTVKEDSFAEAERRHKWAKAAQEELKLKKIEGMLVTKAAVEARYFAIGRRVRDAFKNLPARVSGMLAAERDQGKVFALLTKEIQQILEELSDVPR